MKALGGQIIRRDLSDFADEDYERRAHSAKSRVASARRDIAHDYQRRKRNLTSRVKSFLHLGSKEVDQK
jgi:hypothetical protein